MHRAASARPLDHFRAATCWPCRTGRTRTPPASRAARTGTRWRRSPTSTGHRPAATRSSRRAPADGPPRRVVGRRRAGRPRAAPAVAADDRLRAPQPPAERRDRPAAGAIGADLTAALRRATTSWASRRSGRTASCATTSASTARSTASRCTTSPASTGSTTCCWRWVCGRSSSCRSCRATWPRDPDVTVFGYGGDRVPAEGLGPLGRPDPRPGRAPGRALRAGRGPRPLVVRGVERGQPRGVLVRHARRVLAAVRRDRERRAVGRRPAAWSAARRPRPPAGSTGSWSTSRRPAHRSTSSPPTPTATRRWTCGRRSRGTAARTRRSGGPSGGSAPRTSATANDAVFAAAFLLRGMRSAAGRIDALSYWVVSDQFEELGRPPRLLHGGFGLRTVGEPAQTPVVGAVAARAAGSRRGRGDRDRRRRGQPGRGVGVARRRPRRRRAVERHPGPVQGRRVRRRWPAPLHVALDGLPDGEWTVRESRVDADALEHRRPVVVDVRRSRLADRRAVGTSCARPTAWPSPSARWTGPPWTSTCPTRRSCWSSWFACEVVVAHRRRLPGVRPVLPGRGRRRRR